MTSSKKRRATKRKRTKKAHATRRRTAGWREWVSLPELGIADIKAKLDTGARSSALHAFAIERYSDAGTEMVRFSVHPVQRDPSVEVHACAELLEERDIRDTSGRVERRPVIRTDLELGGERWPVEVSLSRRDEMGFRMLIGRQAIKRRLVVDPATSFRLDPGPPDRPADDEEE